VSGRRQPSSAIAAAIGPPSQIMYCGLKVLLVTIIVKITRIMSSAACEVVPWPRRHHSAKTTMSISIPITVAMVASVDQKGTPVP